MSKYRKRFSEDEFARELRDHIKSMPSDFTEKQLEQQAKHKARHYKKAVDELDNVSRRLKKLAEKHGDDELKKEVDFSISRIERAIGAYGEASMVYNHMFGSWEEPDQIDD